MTWDSSKPESSDLISNGDNIIRELKTDITTALTTEGIFPGTDTANPVFRWKGKRGAIIDRPAAPSTDELFFNTELTRLEYWDGAAWTGYDLIAALGVTTAKLAATSVTAAKLGSDVAGDGLTGGNGSAMAVNPDGTTLEISSDAVRVKDLGISTAKIAAEAVTNAKLGTDISAAKIVAGTLAVARGGTGITTKVFAAVTYTGNSSAGHTVAHGMGATPDMVFIVMNTNNNYASQIWTANMSAGYSKNIGGSSYVSSEITSVDATNITLGSGYNTNYTGYSYTAFCFKSQ